MKGELVGVMDAEEMFPRKESKKPAPKPPRVPARRRVIRCDKCRSYLFDIDLLRCDPGTKACVLISLRCRNKKCRKPNQVTIDLVNNDPPQKGLNGAKDTSTRGY